MSWEFFGDPGLTTLTLTWAAISHRWARSLSTMLSVTLATGTVCLGIALQERLSASAVNPTKPHVLTLGSNTRMTLAMLNALHGVEGVNAAGPVEYLNIRHVMAPDKTTSRYWVVTDHYLDYVPPGIIRVPPDVYQRWVGERGGVLADANTAQQLGWKVGSAIDYTSGDERVVGTLSGLVQGSFSGFVIHYATWSAQKSTNTAVQRFVIPCQGELCDQLPARIDAAFDATTTPTFSVRGDKYAAAMNKRVDLVPRAFVWIAAIIFLVTLGLTMTNLSLNVGERMGELATYRAIGFARAQVLRVFLIESVLVSFTGGLIGALSVSVLSRLMDLRFDVDVERNLPLVISPSATGIALLLSVLLGVLVMLPVLPTILRKDVSRLLYS